MNQVRDAPKKTSRFPRVAATGLAIAAATAWVYRPALTGHGISDDALEITGNPSLPANVAARRNPDRARRALRAP